MIMTLNTALDEFFIDQQIKGNTPKTIRSYRQALKRFTDYAGEDMPLSAINLACLRGYYRWLVDSQISSTSTQTYIRALRAFLRWIYLEEYIEVDWSVKFRLPKAQRKMIDVLTDDEIRRLLGCFDQRYIIQFRNYCICLLMLDCGLRMNEVTTLTLEHMKANDGYAIVDGKGQKQRIVPLGLHVRKALIKYLAKRPGMANTDRLFLQANLTPITDDVIHNLFYRLKETSAIPRLRPHLLRHTFATKYLENGGDIYALQQILGHTTLEMVKRYVHLNQGKTVNNHCQYSPIDRLAKNK